MYRQSLRVILLRPATSHSAASRFQYQSHKLRPRTSRLAPPSQYRCNNSNKCSHRLKRCPQVHGLCERPCPPMDTPTETQNPLLHSHKRSGYLRNLLLALWLRKHKHVDRAGSMHMMPMRARIMGRCDALICSLKRAHDLLSEHHFHSNKSRNRVSDMSRSLQERRLNLSQGLLHAMSRYHWLVQ